MSAKHVPALVAAGLTILGLSALAADAPRPTPRPSVNRARPARARPARVRATPTPTPTPTPRPPDDLYDKVREMSLDEIDRLNLLGPVYFDEASAEIRAVDVPVLANNAAVLKRFDFLNVTLEAHCDGRGDVDYNLRLGDLRARAVLKRMVALGTPASRMRAVSFGKEVPLCEGGDEDCLTRSRRVHFAVSGKRKE